MKPFQASIWMTLIIGLSTSISATLAAITYRDTLKEERNEFREKYDKTFSDKSEDNYRFPFFFLENKMKVIKHNRRQTDGLPSYTNYGLNNNINNQNYNSINNNNKYPDSTNDEYAKALNGYVPNMKKKHSSLDEDKEMQAYSLGEPKRLKTHNRWTDWHDMNIDLASSDSSAGNLYSSYPTKTATKRASKIQRPPILVKRFGSFPIHSSGLVASPPSTNSSTSVAGTKVGKHRRRRIKTLLPVGLSSWFLGGIRALDGRHWHLPAEVINRLAVNDVDFNNGHHQPKLETPTAGNVIMLIKPNAAEQVTPPTAESRAQNGAERATATIGNTPNKQFIPR